MYIFRNMENKKLSYRWQTAQRV